MLCHSRLPSVLIYLRRGRGSQGKSAGMRKISLWVNSKTTLVSIAGNTLTLLGHIAHHEVG